LLGLPLTLASSAAVLALFLAASPARALGVQRALYGLVVVTFPPLILAFISIAVFRSNVVRVYFAKAR
jgi:hypothetical protein